MGNQTLLAWVIGTSSAVTAAAILAAVRSIRNVLREHNHLVERSEQHDRVLERQGQAIEANTAALRRQGDVLEKQGKAIDRIARARPAH